MRALLGSAHRQGRGPSLSFGESDATIVVAKSTAFADACATAIGNRIKKESDIQKAIDFAKGIKGINGVVLIKGKRWAPGEGRFLAIISCVPIVWMI